MPFFGQEIFEKAEKKGPLTDAAYVKARDTARRLAGKDGLLAALEQGQARCRDRARAPRRPGSPITCWAITSSAPGYGIAAVAGTPSLTVPMGESHGLPHRHHVHGPRLRRRRI